MNKSEIIQAMACANVPAGAQLAQHEIGGGLTIARIGPGQDVGGLKIMMAQMFAEQLEEVSVKFPDAPDAALLAHLHRSSSEFYVQMIEGMSFEAVQEEAVMEYRVTIERLRQIAQKLGIVYEEPDDPLLK